MDILAFTQGSHMSYADTAQFADVGAANSNVALLGLQQPTGTWCLPLVSCSQEGVGVQHAGGSASIEVPDHRIWRSVTGLLGLVAVDGLYS